MQNYCHANAALQLATCTWRARDKRNNCHSVELDGQHYCDISTALKQDNCYSTARAKQSKRHSAALYVPKLLRHKRGAKQATCNLCRLIALCHCSAKRFGKKNY